MSREYGIRDYVLRHLKTNVRDYVLEIRLLGVNGLAIRGLRVKGFNGQGLRT